MRLSLGAIEHQAKSAGIDLQVLEYDYQRQIAKISVNGKIYTMSTDYRNFGMLDTGSTIFRVLSSIANGKKRKKR